MVIALQNWQWKQKMACVPLMLLGFLGNELWQVEVQAASWGEAAMLNGLERRLLLPELAASEGELARCDLARNRARRGGEEAEAGEDREGRREE